MKFWKKEADELDLKITLEEEIEKLLKVKERLDGYSKTYSVKFGEYNGQTLWIEFDLDMRAKLKLPFYSIKSDGTKVTLPLTGIYELNDFKEDLVRVENWRRVYHNLKWELERSPIVKLIESVKNLEVG